MEEVYPNSLRQRRRRDRHVSFGHLDNEPYDIPHRRYPPTPTRLSPTFYNGKYPHWKRDLGIFLVLTCIIIGLSADYALAADNDTPVICYFGSWSNLEKCPTSIEAEKDNSDALSKADKSGKALAIEGVFEKGLHFVDHIKQLARLTEQLHIAEASLGWTSAFRFAASALDRRSNKATNPDSAWSQLSYQTDTLEFALQMRVLNNTRIMEDLIRHAESWTSGHIFSFKLILDDRKFGAAGLDKYIRSGLVDSLGWPISMLRADASQGLENTDITLMLVEGLKIYYRILANPTKASRDTNKRVSVAEAKSLADPEYWWKQLSPYLDRASNVDTKSLASCFSGLLKIEELLGPIKKSQEELVAVLVEFEEGVKRGTPLSGRGKVTKEVLEGWLPILTPMVVSLEQVQAELLAMPDRSGKKKSKNGK
ncbi:hypothetical protein DL98DRAFT_574133 [Cadophora sp. DSE1049]|nr:hypothetical protein DL98DRAFT_574133 [Cadophora sp. DSE1049]